MLLSAVVGPHQLRYGFRSGRVRAPPSSATPLRRSSRSKRGPCVPSACPIPPSKPHAPSESHGSVHLSGFVIPSPGLRARRRSGAGAVRQSPDGDDRRDSHGSPQPGVEAHHTAVRRDRPGAPDTVGPLARRTGRGVLEIRLPPSATLRNPWPGPPAVPSGGGSITPAVRGEPVRARFLGAERWKVFQPAARTAPRPPPRPI